jgi:hypothetical protein
MENIFREQIGERKTQPVKRSLGAAIILVAINDYRCGVGEDFDSAQEFLYGTTPGPWRDRWNWVLSEAEGIDPAWLRCRLVQFRPTWDRERQRRAKERHPTRTPRAEHRRLRFASFGRHGVVQ